MRHIRDTVTLAELITPEDLEGAQLTRNERKRIHGAVVALKRLGDDSALAAITNLELLALPPGEMALQSHGPSPSPQVAGDTPDDRSVSPDTDDPIGGQDRNHHDAPSFVRSSGGGTAPSSSSGESPPSKEGSSELSPPDELEVCPKQVKLNTHGEVGAACKLPKDHKGSCCSII